MKKYIIIFILLTECFCSCSFRDGNRSINGSFERLDNKKFPLGWSTSNFTKADDTYEIVVDSSIVKNGKYSISIKKLRTGTNIGAAIYTLSKHFSGAEIELKGYLKVQNVINGFAGLMLRVEGKDKVLSFDNMQNLNIHGTADWKEFSIKLPYDDQKAVKVVAGGLLTGNGKMWIDNLRLYIDGKSVDFIDQEDVTSDTSTNKARLSDTIMINNIKIKNLTLFAQVWGFLKYHHPSISDGNFDMDKEFLNAIPVIVSSNNNRELSDNLEKWVGKFGIPEVCLPCKPDTSYRALVKPDYGDLLNNKILTSSLTKKLKYILDNRGHRGGVIGTPQSGNYYVSVNNTGNVSFNHEADYNQYKYPNINYRLLCLSRYWNMIQYFYPNKHLIETSWNNVLSEFIPKFIRADNETNYILTVLELIGKVQDTHANIWSYNSALEHFRGQYKLPLTAKFVQNRLVSLGYYKDSMSLKKLVLPGDIINKIDGKPVYKLINKYLAITPASNYSTQLRDMPNAYLLRSNKKKVKIEIIRGKTKSLLDLTTIDYRNPVDSDLIQPKQPYYLLLGNIGYLFAGKYKNTDLPKIQKMFRDTKGIVVDMRCYPSDFMPYTFVPFIKSGKMPFAVITYPDIFHPGTFKFGNPLENNGRNAYKGKVVVIVDERTQSQAEFTVMAFQSSPNVKVIGNTTAGADGDIEPIVLPGGIKTAISGLGILYPDGTETQRSGVKINFRISPSIDGIRRGKDEVFEKAKSLINRD